jgi:hypothetical protein
MDSSYHAKQVSYSTVSTWAERATTTFLSKATQLNSTTDLRTNITVVLRYKTNLRIRP